MESSEVELAGVSAVVDNEWSGIEAGGSCCADRDAAEGAGEAKSRSSSLSCCVCCNSGWTLGG